jgi:hypothetical protein
MRLGHAACVLVIAHGDHLYNSDDHRYHLSPGLQMWHTEAVGAAGGVRAAAQVGVVQAACAGNHRWAAHHHAVMSRSGRED